MVDQIKKAAEWSVATVVAFIAGGAYWSLLAFFATLSTQTPYGLPADTHAQLSLGIIRISGEWQVYTATLLIHVFIPTISFALAYVTWLKLYKPLRNGRVQRHTHAWGILLSILGVPFGLGIAFVTSLGAVDKVKKAINKSSSNLSTIH